MTAQTIRAVLFAMPCPLSALAPRADIADWTSEVRFVPTAANETGRQQRRPYFTQSMKSEASSSAGNTMPKITMTYVDVIWVSIVQRERS
jgi:hypothetical protein